MSDLCTILTIYSQVDYCRNLVTHYHTRVHLLMDEQVLDECT